MRAFLCVVIATLCATAPQRAVTAAAATVPVDDKKEAELEMIATKRAQALVFAAKTAYTQNSEWPKSIKELAGYLENGKADLLDPWGKEYQYKLAPTMVEKDVIENRPYVWTERVVGKETKVYGKKPPEKKEPEKKK